MSEERYTIAGQFRAIAAAFFISAFLIASQGSARGADDSTSEPSLRKFPDISDALRAQGWQQLRVAGRPVARFEAAADRAISVATVDSAGFLYRSLDPSEARTGSLSWSWRVDEAPAPNSLRRSGQDDRPLAVHVWFPVELETASLWEALRSGLGKVVDLPVPGKILTYVWGGISPRGTKMMNPYLQKDGAIIVLRPGATEVGRWFEEQVDISADFKMAFGYAPPPASYLVISADTDDLSGRSRAAVKALAFDG